MKKEIKVEESIGKILAHDITEVDIDKKFKGRAFKKGHLIKKEDIPKLKKLGKETIYILELEKDELHENDCAILLSDALMGENTYRDKEPSEGKINIYSSIFGLVKIDVERLFKFNSIGEPSCPTVHNNIYVEKDTKIASVRIISLTAKKTEIEKAIEIAKGGIIKVIPFNLKKVGLIVTGNEIYKGLVEEKFYQKLKPKLNKFKADIVEKIILPDNKEKIKEKIKEFSSKYDMVLLTGGTSVDPDDVTYKAIKESGVNNYIRGNPIQPGNMLTLGWIENIPIIAIPAAALYYKVTSLDIWLPRILIGEKITKEDIIKAGHGGLCCNCKVCIFPNCHYYY